MLAPDLFQKIGFTDEMVETYDKYSKVLTAECDRLAKQFMRDGKDFKESYNQAVKKFPQINQHTVALFFLLECTGYVLEDYNAQGINEDVFYNTMCDITCKIKECQASKGVIGIFVPDWFEGYFQLIRFGLGRLQYELWEHREAPFSIDDFKINTGDKTLALHIPSGSPLTYESVVDSFKKAYEFFSDRVRDGNLIIECSSWLFFPDYQYIFKECAKNTYSFNQNFYFYEVYNSEKFDNCWRVFNVGIDDCVVEELPENTRMQKGFKQYMKGKNKFGGARGCVLFDGENILTRKED